MTTTLTISKAQKNIDRAAKYLQLMEECKAQYRNAKSALLNPNVLSQSRMWYTNIAERRARQHDMFLRMYNDAIIDALILTDNL